MLFCFRIVGDDDGGELFSPEEYKQYKKKVLPMVSEPGRDSRSTDLIIVPDDTIQNFTGADGY